MNNFEAEYLFGNFLEDWKFDELSEFLQSRCHKKNNVNTMAESNIPMHDLIFRCGWHTIFSYIFTSLSNDMRCVKTIDNWFFKQSNDIYGGVPPTLDNMQIEPDLVKTIVDYLFVQITQLTLKNI